MGRAPKTEKWASEADLCAAFIAYAEQRGRWRAYPETAGWDILMVRKIDGLQVGIEAKLTLNVKVLEQALAGLSRFSAGEIGPDLRAVLVPSSGDGGLSGIARALGVTVIRYSLERRNSLCRSPATARPELPDDDWHLEHDWHPWAPMRREALPDYVPDIRAGVQSPLTLTAWKVKAIRIAVLLETRPVTRADFKALQIDPSRWLDVHHGWLKRDDLGRGYVAGPRMPNFRAQHPQNFEEIKADMPHWAPAYLAPVQGLLL